MCRPAAIVLDVGVQLPELVAQQQHGERRVVVHDDAAFAVQDLAARGQDRNGADAVALRQRLVFFRARNLQPRQTEYQHHQHRQDHVLHGRQLEGRDFVVAIHRIRQSVASC